MSDFTYIYALVDPRTLEIRYVGKSICPHYRFRSHCSPRKDKTRKAQWVRSLRKINLKPELFVLERSEDDSWEQREQFWILRLRELGHRLTNVTSGGESGWIVNEDGRNKISEILLNLPQKKREQWIKHLSDSHKGKKQSDETKKKRADKFRGEKSPWFGKSGENHPKSGTKCSLETLDKMRKAHSARSSEHCSKIAAGQRRAWANRTPEKRQELCNALSAGWVRRRMLKEGLINA